jgi:hypothetical protein
VLEAEVGSGAEEVADEWPTPKKHAKTVETAAEAKDESPLEVAEVACKK